MSKFANKRRSPLGSLVLSGLGLLASACKADTQPNVLLITIDTLRADHVGAYGKKKASTPNLDELAQDGALFENAYCDVTWTTPSMSSTMLGQFSARHGMRTTFQSLSEEEVTLAEMLKGSGYATAAVIGSYPLSRIYNLDQGFDAYDDTFTQPLVVRTDAEPSSPEPTAAPVPDSPTMEDFQAGNQRAFFGSGRRTDAEVTAKAISELERLAPGPAPFFLWVHYFGPHHISDSKLDFLEDFRRHIETYPARTTETDAEVGRLLSALARLEGDPSTLVIVHSDHGESLGEHQYVGHGRFLYDDNLRVPMIVRWPGRVPAGSRSDAIVGNFDIASTILDATGTRPAPRPFDGMSMLSVLEGKSSGHPRLVLETFGPTLRGFAERRRSASGEVVEVGVARFGYLEGGKKFIRTEHRPLLDGTDPVLAPGESASLARREFYDTRSDPGENTDLLPAQGDTAGSCEKAMDEFRAAHGGQDAERLGESTEHAEKLRSLGYVQ